MDPLAAFRAFQAASPQASLLTRVLGGGFFGACAVLCFGLGFLLAYETIAIVTGAVPTISVITGGWASNHPVWTGVICLAIGFVVGALVTHLTGWKP